MNKNVCIRGNQRLKPVPFALRAFQGRRVIGASGYPGYPGYPGYLLPFFMGKMLLIIYNIIKLLYIPQFQKKNTLGNRGNRGNQGLRGLIAQDPGQRRTTSGLTHCHVKKK